jgi:hypothetical protein
MPPHGGNASKQVGEVTIGPSDHDIITYVDQLNLTQAPVA